MEATINDIRDRLFERGLEVELIRMEDNEYHISPYPISMDIELLLDDEILDWVAGTAKACDVL